MNGCPRQNPAYRPTLFHGAGRHRLTGFGARTPPQSPLGLRPGGARSEPRPVEDEEGSGAGAGAPKASILHSLTPGPRPGARGPFFVGTQFSRCVIFLIWPLSNPP